MLRQRKRILIIALLIIAVVFGVYHFFFNKKNNMEGGMPPSAVSTVVAKMQDWQPRLQATGTLNAEQGTLLKSEITGRVTKIDFESGQTVKAGDPLIEINPGIAKAQLAAAEAQANLSKVNYDRAVELYKKKVLSKQDLDTASENKKADDANVAQYQATVSQYVIHAPISGKLGLRLFNLGDYINQGQALVNLQSTDPLRIDFSIPENKLHQIQVGDKLSVHADSYPDDKFTGKVTAIDSAVDANTRTVLVRAQIANPDQKLIPGNFVQVTLYAGKPKSYVTVPQIAVVYELGNNFAYILKDNKAMKKSIEVTDQTNDNVAIKSGLQSGDVVITEGQLKLQDGAPVYVIH